MRVADFALILMACVGCATPGLPEALPQGSPVRADAPVAPVTAGSALASKDPLAWPPLAPASGGGHHHGPASQPVAPMSHGGTH